MINIVIMFIIAYLLGSIPSGVLIAKNFYKKDLHKEGSGNVGTTNTFRVIGRRAGIIVFIVDLLKGTLATLLPLMLNIHSINPLLIGLGAIIGHTFSIFDHFQGGKAVATSAGVLLAYNPSYFLIGACIFLALLFLSSMVSFASIIIGPTLTLISLLYHDTTLTIVSLFLTIIIIYLHRKNIQRILNGNENMVPFGLYYSIKKHN